MSMQSWETMTEGERQQFLRNQNPGGYEDPTKPLYPTLESWLNKNNNGQYSLAPNLQTAPGVSSWQDTMLKGQGIQELQARDAAAKSAAGARATGFSDIARRGGISSGAATSLGKQSMNDYLNSNQMIGQQGQQARLGIQSDAQNKLMNAQQFDIGNLLTQKRLEDAAKVGKYGEEMRAWGANKTADATANSGGGLSWICTEIHAVSELDKKAWENLALARKYAKATAPEAYEFYFGSHGDDLLAAMKKSGFSFIALKGVIEEVINAVTENKMEKALRRYWQLVASLSAIFTPWASLPKYKVFTERVKEEKTFETAVLNKFEEKRESA